MKAEGLVLHWETFRARGVAPQQHFTVLSRARVVFFLNYLLYYTNLASETVGVETLVQSGQSLHSLLALFGNYRLPGKTRTQVSF